MKTIILFTALALSGLIGWGQTCNNDYACGPPSPMALTINSSCVNTSCSTVGATPPSPNIPANCDASGTCGALYNSNRYDDDVWFTITPTTSNQVTIRVTPTSNLSNFDPDVFVYQGTCSSPTQIACRCINGNGGNEQLVFTPTSNTTYLIRVFSYGAGSSYTGNFNICVTQQNTVTYDVTVSASPSAGGNVSGGGTFNSGATCNLTASANNGYMFENWTENGNTVSNNSSYTFTVSDDRDLVANFTSNSSTLPDLVIQGTSPSFNDIVAGSSTIISFSVKNNGNANAGQSIASFHLSNNTTLSGSDIFLTETSVPSVASTGSTSILKQQVNIPSSTTIGTWYILISADGSEIIDEDDEDNTTYIEINVSTCYNAITDYYKTETNYYGNGDPAHTDCMNDVYSNSYDSDEWAFLKYQCTSYTAFMVNKSWGYIFPEYQFNNTMTNPALSNANNWASRLSNLSYTVDENPSVGSIAWWDANDPGMGSNGHVAFVNCVNGTSIVVSEYNFDKCIYGTRNLDLSQPNVAGNRTPKKFIHTEVGGLGGGSTSIYQLLAGEENISIYPNPSDGIFTIQLSTENEQEIEISVSNILGQLIYQIPPQKVSGEFSTTISLIEAVAGVYFVRVQNGQGFVTKKIIINR